MKITKVGILKSYKRLSDKSVNVTLNLNEIPSSDIVILDEMSDNFGVFYFRATERLNSQELQELDELDIDLYDEPKSASQRLRNVLFVCYKQLDLEMEFKDFYKNEMEKIITHYKSQLDA